MLRRNLIQKMKFQRSDRERGSSYKNSKRADSRYTRFRKVRRGENSSSSSAYYSESFITSSGYTDSYTTYISRRGSSKRIDMPNRTDERHGDAGRSSMKTHGQAATSKETSMKMPSSTQSESCGDTRSFDTVEYYSSSAIYSTDSSYYDTSSSTSSVYDTDDYSCSLAGTNSSSTDCSCSSTDSISSSAHFIEGTQRHSEPMKTTARAAEIYYDYYSSSSSTRHGRKRGRYTSTDSATEFTMGAQRRSAQMEKRARDGEDYSYYSYYSSSSSSTSRPGRKRRRSISVSSVDMTPTTASGNHNCQPQLQVRNPTVQVLVTVGSAADRTTPTGKVLKK